MKETNERADKERELFGKVLNDDEVWNELEALEAEEIAAQIISAATNIAPSLTADKF